MAKNICKGTIFKTSIAQTLTPVAQVISLELSGHESETYDATTLDTPGAGKEYAPTGYTEGGNVSGELFYDPALADHMALTDQLHNPSIVDQEVELKDVGATKLAFETAGMGFDLAVDMNDGLRASFNGKLNQLASWPGAGSGS